MPAIWIIFIAFMILSWLIGQQLKSKFNAFSKIPINYGLTGRKSLKKCCAKAALKA
jgi:uncharacterized protein